MICWHIWCVKTIRSWWSHDHLCTKGPYRFVRHPYRKLRNISIYLLTVVSERFNEISL